MTLTFAEKLGVNVLLLPMGRADDGAQCVLFLSLPWSLTRTCRDRCSSTNEKLDISNFIEGVRLACGLFCDSFLMAVLSDQGSRDVFV